MTAESSSNRGAICVRRADRSDDEAVISVCAEALDWSDGGVDAEFFAWKHRDSPFGPSPIWVAEDAGQVIGVRAMMSWELVRGTERLQMARAVDTATLPSHQGRGIFSRLTRTAVDELTSSGVAAVFNTPNDKSRPGYMKLGWSDLGRAPVTVRPRTPLALVAMARSRTAADKWGQPTDCGLDPTDALADAELIGDVVDRCRPPTRWSTPLSVDYLRWRTGFGPLQCRIAPLGGSLERGFIVFRLRRRGSIRQLSLLHVVAPGRAAEVRRAVGVLLRRTEADVALASGFELGLPVAMVPLPLAGPRLTWRPLARTGIPAPGDLDLPLGALELF